MTTAVSRVTPCPPGFSDHVYKIAHGVEIPLRIWPAPGEPRDAPWLLWIHGGGFISGKHSIPNAWVIPAFQMYGFHIVSVAYRLMPHVQMPEILEDCIDSFKWCRKNLPSVLGEDSIDLDAYVVAGDSAGGTMSTLLGHHLQPKPRIVIDVFGVVDPSDPHFHREVPKSHWEEYLIPRDEKEMEKAMADRNQSKAEYICPWDWELEPNMSEQDLRSFWGMPDFKVEDKHFFRMDLNKYLVRTSTRMALLHQRWLYDSEEAFAEGMKKQSSLYLLDEAEKGSYPPTFLLHGTGDDTVPVEQSYRFAERLRELGVPVGEAYCPGGMHCFENKIEVSLMNHLGRKRIQPVIPLMTKGPDHDGWNEYVVPCMEFVKQHISA